MNSEATKFQLCPITHFWYVKLNDERMKPMAASDASPLSPTVLQVIDAFVASMRADEGIPKEAIDCLETLVRKGTIPKPDEVNAALFEYPPKSEK